MEEGDNYLIEKKKDAQSPILIVDFPDNQLNVNEDEDNIPPMLIDNTSSNKFRFFKLCYNGIVRGRFSGYNEIHAANKAFTSLYCENGNNTAEFYLIECTRGFPSKKYYFIGERIMFDDPQIMEIHDKEIKHECINKIKIMKDEMK